MKSNSRMMIGIGMPKSQSRIGMSLSPSKGSGNEHAIVPGAVAKLSTLDGGETGGERAEQESGGGPERQCREPAAQVIGRRLCLVDDLIDALLGVRLGQAVARCHDLGKIGPIRRSEVAVLADARPPQSRHLGARGAWIRVRRGR